VYIKDENNEVILLDYGFAKRQCTYYGNQSCVGTPNHMAPEVSGKIKVPKITEKAEIFSLGCILYYLITGEEAFTGNEKDEKELKNKIDTLQEEVD
jgi:serine/threonine protein kinase